MTEGIAAGEARPARPGVLDLYRAMHADAARLLGRSTVAIPLEVGLLVAWLAVRSATPAAGPLYLSWAVVVAGLTILSPTTGLVILVAIAPFDEPYTVSRVLGLKHLLVGVLALSVGARVIARPRSMPWTPALVLGGAIALGTLAGVVNTYRKFDLEFAQDSAQLWLAGVGGAMAVLLAAAWATRAGGLRPLAAATAAGVVAASVSLLDYVRPGIISGGPLEWMVHTKDFGFRISGVIPSPNGLAALLIVPALLLGAAVVFAPGWRLRLASLVGLVPIVPTLFLTYSRSVFLATFGFALVVAFRVRRWLGVAVLVAGLAVGAVALPAYLQLRNEGIGGGGSEPTSGVLVASDTLRFTAWRAAAEMWLDQPLVGYGFRSYKLVGDRYGDSVLNSPHNEWLRLFAEEGTLVGLVGLAFVALTLWRLSRVPGWLGAGATAGWLGYVIAATFNNPLLFIQVSLVVFTIVGAGLARMGARPPPAQVVEGLPEPAPEAAGPEPTDGSAGEEPRAGSIAADEPDPGPSQVADP